MHIIIITSIFKLDRNPFENACYAWCIYSYRSYALKHIVGSTFVYILTALFLLYLKTHTPSCIFSKFWSFCSTWRATCTFILIRLDINKTLTNKWQHIFLNLISHYTMGVIEYQSTKQVQTGKKMSDTRPPVIWKSGNGIFFYLKKKKNKDSQYF